MKSKKIFKLFFTIFFIFVAINIVKAQEFPKDKETGLVVYEGVVDFPDMTQKEIYTKAKSWIITTLKSSDKMTELDDENYKQIVGTGTILLDSLLLPDARNGFSEEALLNFKFIVFCKEGRLKYSIENFLLIYTYWDRKINDKVVETSLENIKSFDINWSKKKKAKFKVNVYECVDKNINLLIESYIYNMNKKTEDEEDW